jgi:hypothetical protein
MAKRFKADQKVRWKDSTGKVLSGKVTELPRSEDESQKMGIFPEDRVVIVSDEHGLPRGVPIRLLESDDSSAEEED